MFIKAKSYNLDHVIYTIYAITAKLAKKFTKIPNIPFYLHDFIKLTVINVRQLTLFYSRVTFAENISYKTVLKQLKVKVDDCKFEKNRRKNKV
jgi:hypothetical protein